MNKIILSVLLIGILFSSCKKEQPISITIIASLNDYNSFDASYVSIKSIVLGSESAPLDFESWSNIGLGDIREIPVTVMSMEEEFNLTVISSGSGSGVIKETNLTGVVDGDLLHLDLDKNEINKYDPSNLSGKWERSDGASYIKISGSNIFLCNGSSLQEFSGTINGNDATLTEGSTTVEFKITAVGDDILVEQYISNNHVGSQMYYKTSNYPCN